MSFNVKYGEADVIIRNGRTSLFHGFQDLRSIVGRRVDRPGDRVTLHLLGRTMYQQIQEDGLLSIRLRPSPARLFPQHDQHAIVITTRQRVERAGQDCASVPFFTLREFLMPILANKGEGMVVLELEQVQRLLSTLLAGVKFKEPVSEDQAAVIFISCPEGRFSYTVSAWALIMPLPILTSSAQNGTRPHQ